jgi:hypothetical protein
MPKMTNHNQPAPDLPTPPLLSTGIDLKVLKNWLDTQAVSAITAAFRPGGWVLVVRHADVSHLLLGQRGKPRQFKRIETVVACLLSLGVSCFSVDAAGYDEAAVRSYSRPDVSRRVAGTA